MDLVISKRDGSYTTTVSLLNAKTGTYFGHLNPKINPMHTAFLKKIWWCNEKIFLFFIMNLVFAQGLFLVYSRCLQPQNLILLLTKGLKAI
ncbi:MAG: hypothetical protein Ct9H300mP29_0310 [Candidatus Neomarinimicrobiota bacterium]|nr:MAG: hypothetical protein Ct9H300mP29_0310 [Candidatus Neomarinimicrobiota bacterium]